jgi:hypothetical protein
MTDDDLQTRVEEIHDRTGQEITAEDLPEGYSNPSNYYTDDEWKWDYRKRNELLLEARGPADIATRALQDLDEVESGVESLERQFLALYEAAFEGKELGEDRKTMLRLTADRIRSGGVVDGVDPSMLEGLRAALVSLTEAAEESE